ncbi:MAG: tetratricopeptide repeat protein [Rhodospirillaceae bacterium]
MLGALIKQLLARRRHARALDVHIAQGERFLNAGALHQASQAVAHAFATGTPDARALRVRGRIAFESGKYAQAYADYQVALALEPNDAPTLLDAAQAMFEMDRFDESLTLADRAVAASPGDTHAHYCRGLMLREMGRYEEAEATMRRACAVDERSLEALCGLALVLVDRGCHGEAEKRLRHVLSVDRNHPVARWQLSVLLLLQGRFEEGWRHYAARWLLYDTIRPRDLPFWNGKDEPTGPLLVLAEQALGDEILFASCFDDLLDRTDNVVIECDPRLAELFARSFPRAVICRRDVKSATPAVVTPTPIAQIAAGSLPALYRPNIASFPQRRGYLRADRAKTEHWRQHLAALGPGLKVGLSWRGGTAKTRSALRSLASADLVPLLHKAGVVFINLQYGDSVGDRTEMAAMTGCTVHHWPEALADYDETAALVAALDLVVTVQTAVAHLAGALGRPVWIMLPASPEWRYLASGTSLPWYPSARLFRQRRVADWSEVVASVGSALDEHLTFAASPVA